MSWKSVIVLAIVAILVQIALVAGSELFNPAKQLTDSQILTQLADREIFAPDPLKGSMSGSGATLSVAGVFSETNRHRAVAGLSTLTSNDQLNLAAAAKLKDMLNQQYFEHINPDGRGPAEVVEAAGYSYLRTGENLALGNFSSDQNLVQAWMDSPGHRANILNDGFTEIGVAVGHGFFEGQDVWLSVQSFGLPSSTCPAPQASLRAALDQQQTKLENLHASQQSISEDSQALADQGSAKVTAGNTKIDQGNQLAAQGGDADEVQKLWTEGQALQTAGQTLIEQAQAKFDTSEDESNLIRVQQTAANQMVARLNAQINQFNTCLASYR